MRRLATALALILSPAYAAAHDAALQNPGATVVAPDGAKTPFPIAIGGPFDLIDQHGRPRSEVDPDGHLQLVFFGYASCREICSAALPQMAEVADALAAQGVGVTPVLITVDPSRDTPAAMADALGLISPQFIGLTGDAAALNAAYAAFSVESEKLFQDPDAGSVYAHGSLIFLLDSKGKMLTLIPPILPLQRVIDLVANYASPS